jgi:hypothetical protein
MKKRNKLSLYFTFLSAIASLRFNASQHRDNEVCQIFNVYEYYALIGIFWSTVVFGSFKSSVENLFEIHFFARLQDSLLTIHSKALGKGEFEFTIKKAN